jgi:signal transduction histidine kinase/HAMP domain-containing protein
MAAMRRTSWAWWSYWQQSILLKIGALFILPTLAVCTYLITASNLSGQLTGVSKAIEQAGAERMRIYKVASLIQRLSPSSSERERAAIREEIARFESVVEGLNFDKQHHNTFTNNPLLAAELQQLHVRWSIQLKAALELALKDGKHPSAVQSYLNQADDFVARWDHLVQLMEHEAAARLETLRHRQAWFLVVFLACMAAVFVFLHRFVREPLKHLTAGANRLAAGDFNAEIRVPSEDELGQLARTFQHMANTIRHHIGELNSLHATGQEIAMLEPGGLEEVLRRIADRAAESLEADLAVVLVRHPTMDCWVVEAASGQAFDRIRKQIVLLEEAPFSNQALDTEEPVVVADLSTYHAPMRLRDEFHAKSYLGVPLLGPHECPGVLALLSTLRTRVFTEWDIRMAQQFASHAAVAMENARLFDALESESQDLQKQLDAVERKVAELTHEVKAPAGRVAEFASWIERDYGRLLDVKGLQYLAWIKNEGKDLATLAERTLDLARIKHEATPVESVDVGSVVGEILALLKQDGRWKGIRVTIAPDLPKLLCCRIHVRQIFENLVGNAMKYMGRQLQPHVEIGWLKDGQAIKIFVRDNGAGIEASMLDRIFLPFVRLGTEKVEGSGIGLSIVKTVVEQYQGSVTVQSSPGVGTTFYVLLPVLCPSTDHGSSPAEHNGSEANGEQTVSRRSMLVGSEERSI